MTPPSSSPTITVDLSRLHEATNSAYVPLYDAKTRYIGLVGGRGSGKSEFAAMFWAKRVIEGHNERLIFARKVARTCRLSVFKLFRDLIARHQWDGLFRVNLSDMTITCANGNEIYCVGLDDHEKLKSIPEPTGVWAEEATEMTKDDIIALDLLMRGSGDNLRQLVFGFNPILRNHWTRNDYFAGDSFPLGKVIHDTAKDASLLRTTYLHNAWIDQRYKQVLEGLIEKSPRLHRVYTLGEWGESEGLVYSPFKLGRCPGEPDQIIYGHDFGYNNPRTIIRVKLKDTIPYAEEVLYKRGWTIADEIAWLNESGEVVKWHPMYCDPSDPEAILELCLAGYNAMPADNAVIPGIEFVEASSIHTHEGNTNLNAELEAYAWMKDKDGKPMDRPEKSNDHALDALRYALYTHTRQRIPEGQTVAAPLDELLGMDFDDELPDL